MGEIKRALAIRGFNQVRQDQIVGAQRAEAGRMRRRMRADDVASRVELAKPGGVEESALPNAISRDEAESQPST